MTRFGYWVESTVSRFAAMSRVARVRMVGFGLTVLAILAFAATMMRAELVQAVTGWTMDFGVHQVHDQMLFAFLWITLIIPIALMVYRPTRRVNATGDRPGAPGSEPPVTDPKDGCVLSASVPTADVLDAGDEGDGPDHQQGAPNRSDARRDGGIGDREDAQVGSR